MLPTAVKDQFVDLLMESGNVSHVARQLGISRMTAYAWRADREFARDWDSALEISRLDIKEKVIDTACAMGLGKWVPARNPETGDIILDENFEQVLHFKTDHVDTRILSKLMDKTMQDEIMRVDQRTAIAADLHHSHEGSAVVVYSPEGEIMQTAAQG